MKITVREMTALDVDIVAKLHAASWRTAYRGMLRDEFLDGDLQSNRRALWSNRLTNHNPKHVGSIAFVEDRAVGFAFAFVDVDPIWGPMPDNLHVLADCKGKGVGTALLRSICAACLQVSASPGLYLWVYEDNLPACGFYEALGAQCQDREIADAQGGGTVAEWRYS